MNLEEISNQEEEINQRELAQKEIEELEGVLKEYGPYLISVSDAQFIEGMISRRTYFLNGELIENRLVNEVYSEEIIDRMMKHAVYFKEKGSVAYSIDNEMIPEEKLKELINQFVRGPRRIKNHRRRRPFEFALRTLNNNLSLSSNHIGALEKEIIKQIEIERKINEGYIFLDTLAYREGQECYGIVGAKTIVNYGLTGRKNSKAPTPRDIFRFREIYFGPNPERDYDELAGEFKGYKYKTVLGMVQNFMESIDPEKHEVLGITLAKPK